MWNVTDWQKVVFSDESWFVLGTDDDRVRVWRHPGEWYNFPHTVLRHTTRTAGVMVWRAIAYDSRSTLIVMRGTLTGQRYDDDFLRPHVGPFLNGLPGAIFQQNNARPHTARVAQDFLCRFQTLPWPALSPRFVPCRARVRSAKTADVIVSLCTLFRVGCLRFVGPSTSGQHKVSNQFKAGPCGGMYCSWRWSNALLKLPSICAVAHPAFV
ncbi:transposable element Tcb2 transposase [Trichonephila clavipes]|nr:transposable element Tcb2 transposase [Trichonephila clavipes]